MIAEGTHDKSSVSDSSIDSADIAEQRDYTVTITAKVPSESSSESKSSCCCYQVVVTLATIRRHAPGGLSVVDSPKG